MREHSEETKRKMSEAAKRRWAELRGEGEVILTNRIARSMRKYWREISKTERTERAKRAAETRRRNRLKGEGGGV